MQIYSTIHHAKEAQGKRHAKQKVCEAFQIHPAMFAVIT